MNTINVKTLAGACVMAVALAAWLPTDVRADDMKPMKAGEHSMMIGVTNAADITALKDGDTMAMVCSKCKTVWVTRVKQGTKGAEMMMASGQPTELIGTHDCPGCKSKLTVTGHAKGDITELKHSCAMCGDDSAFCCVTKAGGKPTMGMEKSDSEKK